MELVLISSDTTLEAGQTGLLGCVGFGEPYVSVTWWYNGMQVLNGSSVTVSEVPTIAGATMFMQSFVQLCSVSNSDAGTYTCAVSNGVRTLNASTQLTVTRMLNLTME